MQLPFIVGLLCYVLGYDIEAEDKALFLTAERTFGSWAYALESAGISKCRIKQALTHYQIIGRIWVLYRRGNSLSIGSIRRKQKHLYTEAVFRFHDWWSALSAAGLEPELYHPPQYWSKAMVVEIIQKRYRQNQSLFKSRMRFYALQTAADRWFGSWESAVLASGVPLLRKSGVKSRSIVMWNHKSILACIRSRVVSDLPIHSNQIRLRCGRLYNAAGKYFGGWAKALAAAGVSDEDIRNSRNRART